jgi:two-component system LytT family sensor kinase
MHNAAFFIKYKLHHFLFWMLLLGLWYYLRYQDYSTEQIAFQVTFVKVCALAAAVYITNYFLIPRLLYKKWYVGFSAAFIALIIVSGVVKIFLISRVMHDPAMLTLSGNLKSRFYENVISDFFLIMAGAAFKLIVDYTKMQQRLAEVGKEKAETELNFLKSQINPHFLFNSLNSVYFLIDKNNADARQALHTFSDMLRYQLYEANGEKIPIEKEISYLQDYVHLQQLRKDENYIVQFNCSPEVKNFSIEPLLLIPFVENAFKHISHKADRINFVRLDLNRSNGYFEFAVENSQEKGIHTTEQHGGIGMNNVKRRLELLYHDVHKLDVTDEANTFKINLKLKI